MEVDVSNSEASSQTQPQLNMKNPHSLLDLCAHSLATKPHVVQYALDIGLPSKIIIIIYTSAIRYLVSDYHKGLRDSIIIMTSHWPREELSIVDLVGEERGTAVLTGNTGMLLIDWLIEGLLTMRSEAKLRTLDLSGFTASKMFLVPLMWLPPEERTVEVLLNEIHSKYGHFLAAEDDNIETALNWKVSQLENSKLHGRFQGNGPGRVEIRVDCQAKVPDWTTMVDALLGLLVSGRTPFTVSIHKLSVNNYHYNYSHRVKWLLSMMDKTSVQRMGLYGYRGSIAQSVHELHKDLKQFQSLTWFAWATCGPKVERDYNCSGPSDQELLIRTADVFHTWSNLTEACFHGVLLTDQLAILLNALPSPLRVLYLVKNELSMRDVDYLAWSHHLDSLRDLTIEKNDLEKMGQYVIELVQNGTSIKFLNLKDDHLLESDKIEIMIGLQGSVILKTLILFDTHSMLTPESYEMIVELACHIKTLKNFYIFPFNHEPFDQVLRKDVTEASAEILLQNNRQDLCLAY